eukprot:6492454-Lingulodinium_polyedra.AAC.1
MARASAKTKRGAGKAPAADAVPAGQPRSSRALAVQKAYDNLKDLTVFEREIKVLEATQKTCLQQIEHDLEQEKLGKK